MLLMKFPQVANRDCNHCQEYQYDEETGKPRQVNGTEELMKRPVGGFPPCRTRRGCPKGTPENQLEITPQNFQAYQHYRECKAVGRFPDDGTVRANAVIIQDVLNEVQQAENESILKVLRNEQSNKTRNLR